VFGALGEVRQPASEQGHDARDGVLAVRAAEPRGAAEQPHELDAAGVGDEDLRGVGEAAPAAHVLLVAREAVHIRHERASELRRELEALVAVARLRHEQQARVVGVVAEHRGQRRVRLAGQGQRYEDQWSFGQVDVAHRGDGLRGPVANGQRSCKSGQ
jgi:hypothetical protein